MHDQALLLPAVALPLRAERTGQEQIACQPRRCSKIGSELTGAPGGSRRSSSAERITAQPESTNAVPTQNGTVAS